MLLNVLISQTAEMCSMLIVSTIMPYVQCYSKMTMPFVNAPMNKAIGVGTAVATAAMAAPFSEPRRPDAPLAAPNLKLW